MELSGFSNLEVIGRGGFSVVYRAHQNAQSRDVAIKVLNVDIQDDAQRARFERECAATGKLGSHPNVMTVFESGYSADGKPYIAMELCEGGSLADRIAQGGPLPLDEALHLMIKIAGAVETAHRAGITHRDIKPENMLLTAYGDVVLTDFGISAFDQVRSGTATGGSFTLSHVPPEVLQGSSSEVPGDVYSLASSLFRLLTGKPPFADDTTPIAVAVSKTMNEPVPDVAGVPKSLNKVLSKAMAKTAASRYGSVMALAEALQGVQSELGYAVTNPVATAARTADTTRVATGAAPSRSANDLPSVEVAAVTGRTSTKKVLATVGAAIVLIGGGGAFAFQLLGGSDEKAVASEVTDSTAVTLTETTTTTAASTTTTATTTTSVAGTATGAAVPQTTTPPIANAASPTTAAKKKRAAAPTTTAAATTTTVAPTTTAAPAAPVVEAPTTTTTVAVRTPISTPVVIIPTFTIAPDTLKALTCANFESCAQKLFEAWKAGNRETAKLYATDFAVSIMFASPYSSANTGWAATVTKQTDYIWYISSTRTTRPTRFSFFFNNRQTDFKVQSVVVS